MNIMSLFKRNVAEEEPMEVDYNRLESAIPNLVEQAADVIMKYHNNGKLTKEKCIEVIANHTEDVLCETPGYILNKYCK